MHGVHQAAEAVIPQMDEDHQAKAIPEGGDEDVDLKGNISYKF